MRRKTIMENIEDKQRLRKAIKLIKIQLEIAENEGNEQLIQKSKKILTEFMQELNK